MRADAVFHLISGSSSSGAVLPTRKNVSEFRPRPTTFKGTGNREVDKLCGPLLGRSAAIIQQLIIQSRILLRKGSESASDALPSGFEVLHLNQDGGPGSQIYTFMCFVTGQLIPVTAGVQRIAYHITSTVVL
ncbi:hypothetical protein CSKR_105901, partial [Clonorchis sinensis]